MSRRVLLGRLAAITLLLAVGVPSKWYAGFGERYVIGQVWDVCGSAIVLLTARILFPRARALVTATVVGALLVCNELLQLVYTPWLETARATLPGRVVLGSRFNPLDLLAIALSVAVTAAIDARQTGSRTSRSRNAPSRTTQEGQRRRTRRRRVRPSG